MAVSLQHAHAPPLKGQYSNAHVTVPHTLSYLIPSIRTLLRELACGVRRCGDHSGVSLNCARCTAVVGFLSVALSLGFESVLRKELYTALLFSILTLLTCIQLFLVFLDLLSP